MTTNVEYERRRVLFFLICPQNADECTSISVVIDELLLLLNWLVCSSRGECYGAWERVGAAECEW